MSFRFRNWAAVLRCFAAMICACLLLACLPMGALADVDADYEVYYVGGGFIRVNRYTGILQNGARLSGNLVIPMSVEGVRIVGIEKNAFSDCDDITSVTIPSSVTSIGDSAFFSCDKLAKVTLPSSVQSMGSEVFMSCIALTSIELPEGLQTLGKDAFRYCYSLRSVTLPSTLTQVDDYTFASCLALRSVTIPSGVRRLGSYAFSGCVNLDSVTIPDSVTQLGDYCFSGCTALKNVHLPSSINSLPIAFLDGCSALEQLVVPDGVERINSLAFRNCKSLVRLSLPDSVTSFPTTAISGCSEDLTFYVNAGSFAQAFASANGIRFVLGNLTDDNPDNPGNYAATPFTDDKTHWARSYIEWAYAKGYIRGTTSTTFSPEGLLSRAELVTLLYRIEGSPAVGASGFTDVPDSAYYAPAAAWAQQSGVVQGTGGGKFSPGLKITREQLATMLYRYAGYKGKNTALTGDLNRFKDMAQISTFAGAAMNWAVGAGILTGTPDSKLEPKGYATRAEAAVMLWRFSR